VNLGEFRKATADLPDDTDIFIDLGDLEWMETDLGYKLPPVLDHPWAISLEAGQVCNYEYDIDTRIDGNHLSTSKRWED
jgi:hypothetical protein